MNQKRLISQIINLTLVILLLAGCNSFQAAPTPTAIPPTTTVVPTVTATLSPEQIASLNPSPRGYVSMAYDSESDRVILFGGQTEASYNGETWAYDLSANKWTEMKPSSGPTGRSAAKLAYDIESDRAIMFGGANDTLGLNDTWAYDYNANTWTKMADGPANHLGDRIAYDAESDRIILFGGYAMGGGFYNDTWAYDFNSDTWTEMKPSVGPEGRNYHAMTYNSKSDRVMMWGGDIEVSTHDNSIWAYDFNSDTWQEMKPGDGQYPISLQYPAMTYDVESDRTILYGGEPPIGDDIWAYDYKANVWEKLQSSIAPTMRSRHAIVYNTTMDRVILFGGQAGRQIYQYAGETWTYDFNTNTWTNVTPHP